MVEPILLDVASTLAAKATGSLWEFVRARFAKHRDATKELEAAAGAEPGSAPVQALAERLAEIVDEDPEFARGLYATYAQHGRVNNQVIGNVIGKVLQVGDIHGDVHF